jgi:hypothetical protein
MANQWFITRDGKQRYGPFSDVQLRELASSGRLSPSDMLWTDGAKQWRPASSIHGLFGQLCLARHLPDFHYATLPGFPTDHRRIAFRVDRAGILTSVSKTVTSSVSGGGGGGYIDTNLYDGRIHGSTAPVWIDTTHKTKIDLWILDSEGRESSLRIKKDIPLKEGHRVTVLDACLDGRDVHRCLILDHTAGQWHFFRGSLKAVRPSTAEGLVVLAAFLTLSLFCVLLGLASVLVAILIGFIAGVIWLAFIFIRLDSQRERFVNHCDRMAKLLLQAH